MKKLYYGFRYLAGENCTWSYSRGVAGHPAFFETRQGLEDWLSKETYQEGDNYGRRVRMTKAELKRTNAWTERDFVEAVEMWEVQK